MGEKKPVYNGYSEMYLTGKELKTMYEKTYYGTGRHHSHILAMTIPEYLTLLGIDDDKTYRIFHNSFFCRVMKGDTDGLVCFFAHTPLDHVKLSHNPSEVHINLICPECGAPMKLKTGRYGEFLSCSKYPNCKYKETIPALGNYNQELGR